MVVGNIGAPGRVNFTVVGDTVNIAQRFEQLGKEFMGPDDECVLLTSGETVSLLTDRAKPGIDCPTRSCATSRAYPTDRGLRWREPAAAFGRWT